MKYILILLLSAISFQSYSQDLTFNIPVTKIDTSKPYQLSIDQVKIMIGDRTTDSTGTYVNVTTHAIDSIGGEDYAIVVRHHKIPASVYDAAYSGFDPLTGKPVMKLTVLAGLLAPYNLKLK